jgi:phosphatidate phosphatase PAH1
MAPTMTKVVLYGMVNIIIGLPSYHSKGVASIFEIINTNYQIKRPASGSTCIDKGYPERMSMVT